MARWTIRCETLKWRGILDKPGYESRLHHPNVIRQLPDISIDPLQVGLEVLPRTVLLEAIEHVTVAGVSQHVLEGIEVLLVIDPLHIRYALACPCFTSQTIRSFSITQMVRSVRSNSHQRCPCRARLGKAW